MGREYTNTKTKGWFQLLHRTFWIKWQMKTNKNYVGEVWKDKKCRMYDCWRSCNESKFSCSHHMPGIVQCWVYAGMPWSSFCGARTDFLKKSGNPDLTRLPKRIITGWAYFLSLWCFIPLRMGNKQSICMFISTVSTVIIQRWQLQSWKHFRAIGFPLQVILGNAWIKGFWNYVNSKFIYPDHICWCRCQRRNRQWKPHYWIGFRGVSYRSFSSILG